MGNSEVGHLNLGAGAVVKQDLTRIDEAVDGRRRSPSNDVLRAALAGAPSACTSSGWSPTAACTPAGATCEALIALARRARAETSSSTPSPTGATRCPTRAPASSSRSRAGASRPATRASARSSAATSRWTATSAGSARSRPTTCSCTAAAEHHADSGDEAVRAAYERDETDEFIEPTTVGDEARIRPRRLRHRLQLPPRPDARDHPRARRAGLRRGRPRRRRADRALRDADRVRGGLALPGRLPARAPRDHAAARHRARRAGASCTSPRPRSTRT